MLAPIGWGFLSAFVALFVLPSLDTSSHSASCAMTLRRQTRLPQAVIREERARHDKVVRIHSAFDSMRSQAQREGSTLEEELRKTAAVGYRLPLEGFFGNIDYVDTKLTQYVANAVSSYLRIVRMRVLLAQNLSENWIPQTSSAAYDVQLYRMHDDTVREVLNGTSRLDQMEARLLLEHMSPKSSDQWVHQLEHAAVLPRTFREWLSETLRFYHREGLGRDLLLQEFLLDLDLIATTIHDRIRMSKG